MSTVKEIPIKSIAIPPGNRDKLDSIELAELAETLRMHGMLSPVIVRPNPKKKGAFTLIAGERRLRAAISLDWKNVEAKELADLTDAEAAEIQLIENLQRVNLTPWEEAHQIEQLINATPGARIEDIALKVGRSPRWVAVRAALGKLEPALRALLVDQDWPLSHLPLLAPIPLVAQPAVLARIRQIQEQNWCDHVREKGKYKSVPCAPSYRDLAGTLADFERLLSSASWKLDDPWLLAEAGSCDQCPKRSSAEASLFPEFTDPKDDRCLDAGCWNAKRMALVALNISKLHEKGTQPVLLKGYGQFDQKAVEEQLGPVEIKSQSDFTDCKKSDPDATPAVIVSGDDAGKVKYVKPVRAYGSQTNGKAKRVNQETGEKEELSTKDRLAALKLKRQCAAAELWSETLEQLHPPLDTIYPLIVHFGAFITKRGRGGLDWKEFDCRLHPGQVAAWDQLCPIFQSRIQRLGAMEQGESIWEECLAQADALAAMAELGLCWYDALNANPLPKVLEKQSVVDDTAMPGGKGKPKPSLSRADKDAAESDEAEYAEALP